MATTTIDNTTVVFSNSTAAANLSTTISESASSYVYNFDVLAYSGGGAKTTIWSVDDGVKGDDNPTVVVSSAFSAYNTDLLYKDAVGTWEQSSLGARFAIVGGKIQYDASALSGQINHLGVGESLNDSLQYTIRMSNGTLSVGTLKVTLTGTNDAVVLDSATGSATTDEDATTVSTGSISFSDADTNDTHTATFTSGQLTTLGNFALGTLGETHVLGSDAQGSVGWTYTVDNTAAQYLHGNEYVDETYTVKIDDGHGGEAYQTVTVRINGVDDAATITDSGDNEDTDVTEAGNEVTGDSSASGTLTVHDLDHDQDTFATVDSADLVGTYGSFTFNEATGAWTYELDDGAADALGAGVTKQDTLTVSSLDGTDSYTITVDIHGTNDAPTITTSQSTYSIDENTVGTIATLSASDVDTVDTADTLTWSLVNTGDYAAFSINASTGELKLTSAQDYETDNQLTVTVKVSDGHGGTATKDITVNIGDVVETLPDPNNNDTVGGASSASETVPGATGGADTIYGGGGDDTLNGGNGNDVLYGGSGNDVISGNNDNDKLYGGDGNDTISGNNGDDTLIGGYGNDSLSGGVGASGTNIDRFTFLSVNDGVDAIADFTSGTDKIVFDVAGFASLTGFTAANFVSNTTGLAVTSTQYLIYNSSTKDLYYDHDGAGGDAAVLMAHLSSGSVAAGDIVII